MNLDFFQSRGLGSRIWNNGALDTQIQWLWQLLPSICGSAAGECSTPSILDFSELDHVAYKECA
jgi:hypothetical protein